MKKLTLTLSAIALSSIVLLGADAPAAAPAATPAAPAQEEMKLVPLMTMQQAFTNALAKRNALVRAIAVESDKLAKADAAHKAEHEKALATARQRLTTLTTYMDTIYGLAGKRIYEYNNVTSEIYLRVGTVTEVFTRALNARNELTKQIAALNDSIEKEKDAAKKAQLEAAQKNLVQRHNLIANALFAIFQIHPKRSYHFDNKTQQLFVRVTKEEDAKLQEQFKKNAEARKAAAEAKKAAEATKK